MDATHLNLVVFHGCAINPSFSSLRMSTASFLGWPDSSIRSLEAEHLMHGPLQTGLPGEVEEKSKTPFSVFPAKAECRNTKKFWTPAPVRLGGFAGVTAFYEPVNIAIRSLGLAVLSRLVDRRYWMTWRLSLYKM